MKMNDPLQTLYQIMSGRQPAAVTVRIIRVFPCGLNVQQICILIS